VNIWSFPRPSAFLDDVEESIRDGYNVVVRFPCSIPTGFEQELRLRLSSDCGSWTSIDAAAATSDPVTALRERVCPDVTALRAGSMAELAHTASFQDRLLWIEGISRSQWAQWSASLAAYADACRSVELKDRTLFVAVLSGAAVAEAFPDEMALVRRDFRNVVDTLDLFMFALCRIPIAIERLEHRALMAHTVSQVARWDCQLAELLLSASLDEALKPHDALREYAHSRGWTSDTSRSWEHGTVDGPSERPIVHSALLAVSGDSRSLRQRLWAAQASVLLPLVDELRVGLIPDCRRYLALPVETERGKFVYDPFDLEIGQLSRCLDGAHAPPRMTQHVRWLRDVRNKLAHLEPLDPQDILDPLLS